MLRKKEEKFLVVFDTTASAMALEKYAKLAGSTGRLIPTPTSIRSGCGFAYSSPVVEELLIRQLIIDQNIQIADQIITII